jgi:hypothetical protein
LRVDRPARHRTSLADLIVQIVVDIHYAHTSPYIRNVYESYSAR